MGYAEQDPIRGNDSWITFEEIMKTAKESDVDMILQAGDLFHINKPSKQSLFHTIRILKKACLGDKPCELELLSDASQALDDIIDHVNYEDFDINIGIPMFSIAGNHDDASGVSFPMYFIHSCNITTN